MEESKRARTPGVHVEVRREWSQCRGRLGHKGRDTALNLYIMSSAAPSTRQSQQRCHRPPNQSIPYDCATQILIDDVQNPTDVVLKGKDPTDGEIFLNREKSIFVGSSDLA